MASFASYGIVFALLTLPSCSLFVGSTQVISVTANEPEAEIWVDGELRGKGTTSVELKRDVGHSFRAQLGERIATETTTTRLSATGAIDIFFGWLLVPLIGLFTPGSMEQDRSQVGLWLPPDEPER